MSHALDETIHSLTLGEDWLAGAMDVLVRRWRASADVIGRDVIGKLCTGAERWQEALRQIQAPVNLAEILRARNLL
jgi:hypothetical protein